MTSYIDQYWTARLQRATKALEKNGFEVTYCKDIVDAREAVLSIVKAAKPDVVSYGDSQSLRSTGALDVVKAMRDISFIDGFDSTLSRPERLELRRKALTCDLFLAGVNAFTEKGQLVWLDMIGNRIAPISFGPHTVVLVIGRNKLTATLDDAMTRVKQYAAPVNAIKHTDFKTPCQATGECHDCASPDRICNTWLIMEKSFPAGRVKIILVNEDLGM